MTQISLPNNWQPRIYQLPIWKYLESGGKRAIAVWHRRAGKDDVCLHWTACAAMQRPGNYWHMLPEASQARKAVWDAVNPHTGKPRIDEAFPLEIRETTRTQDMLIRFINGSTWQVVGSDNFNSLVGSPPVGIVFSEWALANPDSWGYLRPILTENGGWALFISTPRGRNHLYTMYQAGMDDPEWFAEKLTAEDTGVFSAAELYNEKKGYIATYGPDDGLSRFEQEYHCSFEAGLAGSFYGTMMVNAEKEGRVRRVPYDPAHGVETWWDLGVTDSTAIWFAQRIEGEFRLIDYYENSGQGVRHYVDHLKEKGYTYTWHVAPHDADSLQMGAEVMTIAGTAKRLGIKFEIIPQRDRMDGIQAVRNILPLCHFDRENCRRGIDAMRSYRRRWDDSNKVYSANPLHDWASHGADAFRYGASFKPPKSGFSQSGPLNYRNYATV